MLSRFVIIWNEVFITLTDHCPKFTEQSLNMWIWVNLKHVSTTSTRIRQTFLPHRQLRPVGWERMRRLGGHLKVTKLKHCLGYLVSVDLEPKACLSCSTGALPAILPLVRCYSFAFLYKLVETTPLLNWNSVMLMRNSSCWQPFWIPRWDITWSWCRIRDTCRTHRYAPPLYTFRAHLLAMITCVIRHL